MEEQIVLFETAKLAQEKGFNIVSSTRRSTNYYNHLGVFRGDVSDLIKATLEEKDTTPFDTVIAPTQSLLQKWLRDEHKIQIEISLYHCHGKWLGPRYMYLIYKICETEKEWESLNGEAIQQCPMESPLHKENSSMSYEDALESALVHALNLIP